MKKLILTSVVAATCVACDKSDNGTEIVDFTAAQTELQKLYPEAQQVQWSFSRGYHVAKFNNPALTRSAQAGLNTTVWFEVEGNKAEQQMINQDFGASLAVLPAAIQEAFNATEYSDKSLWVIDEIDFEKEYIAGVGKKSVYEIELNSAPQITPEKEAELYFDATTGELLFTKESVDDDSQDRDDEHLVINSQITESVTDYLTPTLLAGESVVILSAELDDNEIEVDAIITNAGKTVREVELTLNPSNYSVIGSESETEYTATFAALAAKYKTPITAWYDSNANTQHAPLPEGTVLVELEETVENGKTKAELEFEYAGWEAEFELTLDGENFVVNANESNVERD